MNRLSTREISGNGCLAKVRSAYTSLSAAERRVADLLLSQPLEAIHLSIDRLAKKSNVAKATVVRFCQSIGYKGYQELKISLAQDSIPVMQYVQEDVLPTDTPLIITRKVLQANIEALSETLKILNNTEMEKAIEAIINAHRVGFYGVGSSSPIANEAYQRFIRMGLKCVCSSDPHVQVNLALSFKEKDVAVGISHSGCTLETVRCLDMAKKNEATTICITNYSGSPLTKVSDIKLITSFKETGFPIEKMGARVAQLAIVEALAVNVAIQIPRKASEYIEKLRTKLKELM
jgi:DNA-binding MurR/RpiR family transcriptional regulator